MMDRLEISQTIENARRRPEPTRKRDVLALKETKNMMMLIQRPKKNTGLMKAHWMSQRIGGNPGSRKKAASTAMSPTTMHPPGT
jgi:hypothetical protein